MKFKLLIKPETTDELYSFLDKLDTTIDVSGFMDDQNVCKIINTFKLKLDEKDEIIKELDNKIEDLKTNFGKARVHKSNAVQNILDNIPEAEKQAIENEMIQEIKTNQDTDHFSPEPESKQDQETIPEPDHVPDAGETIEEIKTPPIYLPDVLVPCKFCGNEIVDKKYKEFCSNKCYQKNLYQSKKVKSLPKSPD